MSLGGLGTSGGRDRWRRPKATWGVAGRGKRGGVRLIYYLRSQQGEIWMLTLYAKNEAESIPAHVLKKIKEELDGKG